MKRIQESAAGKLLAVVLLIASVFAGAGYALKAIQGYTYLDAESYHDTQVFYDLVEQKLCGVAEVFALLEQLKDESLDYATQRHIEDQILQLRESFSEEKSNLRFEVRDEKGESVYELMHDADQYDGWVLYANFVLGEYVIYLHHDAVSSVLGNRVYTIECTVVGEEQLSEGGVQDEFYRLWKQHNQAQGQHAYWLNMLVGCLVVAAVCVLYILWTAGHKAGEEGIVLSWQEKIYFELYLMAVGTAWYLAFCVFFAGYYSDEYYSTRAPRTKIGRASCRERV